ncbi:hypothetical protein BC939DRAFT_466762 [Gamsiella multidivaricata]|uniref:uncharacterized protein n=1 Tax=Gamsiella multidivaricata TaxID=101098 RepID=UPI00221E6B6B|nr:uncharacterized protein BC939DRAFT_466762 [Gamsiella multidivaricata]KAI7817195.1 hypothetical protein BC939DRAFT_466762 [Gamsiella multidivaricata]
MYNYGKGVLQDYSKAMEWYLKAANRGHADAQFILGTMYNCGMGVPRDHSKAREWCLKAADQGHVDAQYSL